MRKKKDSKQEAPTAEEIAYAMQKCFGRKMKYPTVTVGSLRRVIENIPVEYNDSEVAFAFILTSQGDKNFTLGTIPIKLVAINPDQTKVLFCDDAATEEFFKTDAKVSYANEDGVKDDDEVD